jgi:HlyD family secretion protein
VKRKTIRNIALGATVAAIGGVALFSAGSHAEPTAPGLQKATLTVPAIKPRQSDWQVGLSANGSIAPWREVIVGSELGGLRLAEVDVEVGDRVHKGQVLARLFSAGLDAELAQQEATLEESRSALAQAQSNAEGARQLDRSGALSAQQRIDYLTTERTAKARLALAEARVMGARIRVQQAVVTAVDDGVISACGAAAGAVVGQGQELFRLIRGGRLEWRAEVTANDLPRIRAGQQVRIVSTNGTTLRGAVRTLAPQADTTTRNALVYVDLPASAGVRSGMFATGSFELGGSPALTIPQAAVVTRDGFSYVFVIGRDGKVAQTRVEPGRRDGDQIEIVSGVGKDMLLVGQGAGFLADGDAVAVAGPARAAAPKSADLARK